MGNPVCAWQGESVLLRRCHFSAQNKESRGMKMENNYEEVVPAENEAENPVAENTPVEAAVETPVAENVAAENAPESFWKKYPAVSEFMEKATPVKDDLLEKAKKVPKKLWIAISGAAVLLIALIVLLSSVVGNTYKSPVNMMEKVANNKKASKVLNYSTKMLNGFCEDEIKDILDILKKSDDFEDTMEALEEYYADSIENMEDAYGSNYKIKYKITDKEKLDKDELKEIRNDLKDTASEMRDMVEETEDYDSDDWEDLAEESGLSKSQVKKLVKAVEALYKEMKSVKVTKGYELTVTVVITGSELDEPEEKEITVRVFKVNGRWISEEAFSMAGQFLPF